MVALMLYPCISLCCSVNGSVCFVCCVSDSVHELFAETIDRVWSSKECVCCACDASVQLDAPSIYICLCFCMWEVIYS